jgi:hypothetical protein
LEGGGLCVEAVDCMKRKGTSQGSSKFWDAHKTPEGESMTSLSHLNPLANFSHIYVPYCSGDTYLGKSAEKHAALLGLQMSGHLILETIVEHLLNTTSFGSATHVVFSGSSAGGIGVYHHVDWLADTLTAHAHARSIPAPHVVGVPIEGMFFPKNFPVLYPQFVLGFRKALDDFMSQYVSLLQDAWLAPACLKAAVEGKWPNHLCFDASRTIFYTKTPLFIAQNRFDALQIQDVGLCLGCKESDVPSSWEGEYIRFYGALQQKTLEDIQKALPRTGFFIPSEFHHDENFYRFLDTQEKSIAGKSFRAAFEDWYWHGKSVNLFEPTCNQEGPCTEAKVV